jgi:hypothetical protein
MLLHKLASIMIKLKSNSFAVSLNHHINDEQLCEFYEEKNGREKDYRCDIWRGESMNATNDAKID